MIDLLIYYNNRKLNNKITYFFNSDLVTIRIPNIGNKDIKR